MSPEDFYQIFYILFTIVVGLLGMPLIQWVKLKLNLENKAALALAGVLSFLLAGLQLYLAGALGSQSFTLEAFSQTFFTIYASSMIFYKVLIGDKIEYVPAPGDRENFPKYD